MGVLMLVLGLGLGLGIWLGLGLWLGLLFHIYILGFVFGVNPWISTHGSNVTLCSLLIGMRRLQARRCTCL